MTIWKPNMPDNKYKLKIASKAKDFNGGTDTLNNALSMDIMNEIPGLAKTSSTTNKDGTYTRTVVTKTYTSTHSLDDFGKSAFGTSLKGRGKFDDRISMNTERRSDKLKLNTVAGAMTGELTSRTLESAPQASTSNRKVTVRSLPPRSFSTRRVVTSKTSPEITSRTITTRTSSVKIPPRVTSTSRRVVTKTSSADTIPLFSSLSKFATKTNSMQSRPVVTSSGTNPVQSSISESFSSQSSSSRRNLATRRINSDAQPIRSAFVETSTPARQLSDMSSAIKTGIEIPTSKTVSTSEFSSRFTSAKELLPRSGASDFTVIRVRERAPTSNFVEQSSSGSSMRKTTKRFNSFEQNSGSLSSSPTFVTSSMSNSNEATIASPELMPVTAGGSAQASASNNMMETMVAASIATEGDTNVVEGAAEVAGNVVEGAQEVAGNVVENVQEGAEKVVEAVGNVGENIAEAGANAVENVAEGMEKGAEMIAEGAENVVEGVKEVIDDGLPDPLLSARGDSDNTLDIGEVDDKELEMEGSLRDRDSKSREIGASGRLRIGDGDSGEDSNGDGNSDSKEIDSNSGEDSNGDGDSDSEERGGRSYYSRRRTSDSGEDSNGDGDSDSEERGGRRRGSRRGRWWRRGGKGSDSSADSDSSSRGSDSSDESKDGDKDDSGSDSSSSDSMEDDFDYFEDMNDFWMNGGSRSSSRRSESRNLNLQASSSTSSQTSPGYQRGDMRRIISQIRNNGGAVISLPEARSNTMVHFFVKWRKSNISRRGQKMFIRTPEATVAILRHPNRRRN
ncbi:dentin sialophosphoprotein-like [Saccostrea cucullata]|uniref:dentin sialophosphoprotein-like n=1 Tax=Saccostrea cuccullata TaxID=36930 RepID=UPI002ED1B1C1